jgi:excisionase family DNA binding protein
MAWTIRAAPYRLAVDSMDEPMTLFDADHGKAADVRQCPPSSAGTRQRRRSAESRPVHPEFSAQATRDEPANPPRQADDTNLGPRLVTINCAARLLGVGRTTLYEQIAAGDLQVVHIGRATRVPISAIDAFVAELQRRSTEATSAGVRP